MYVYAATDIKVEHGAYTYKSHPVKRFTTCIIAVRVVGSAQQRSSTDLLHEEHPLYYLNSLIVGCDAYILTWGKYRECLGETKQEKMTGNPQVHEHAMYASILIAR